MTNTVKDVLEFVKENDVKFIRLAFCDMFGAQKNISVLPETLESAFENGMPFDASQILGFSNDYDLLLFPEVSTLNVLPWRPQQGRVARLFCNIKTFDKTEYACDTRAVLKKAEERLHKLGFSCKIGIECEFYLFKTDENGEPTKTALDNGGYLDISPLDKCENIRREICLTLEEMGIFPQMSHHEKGPGQNEIDFMFSGPLTCADNLLTFKTVVKAVAARNGLFASFMPKPYLDKNGSGLHINISLNKDGKNIFAGQNYQNDTIPAFFIAGILEKIAEITLFLNPIANSYERFGSFEAPKYISWSRQNRSQLIRIPAATDEHSRMEIRSSDPALNPFLAFALIINAGLDGIERKLQLPPPVNKDLSNEHESMVKTLKALPQNLAEAVKLAESSGFVKNVLNKEIIDKYLIIKKRESDDFLKAFVKEDFYEKMYFKTT